MTDDIWGILSLLVNQASQKRGFQQDFAKLDKAYTFSDVLNTCSRNISKCAREHILNDIHLPNLDMV